MDTCSIVRYKIRSSANSTAIDFFTLQLVSKKKQLSRMGKFIPVYDCAGNFLRNMGTHSGVRYTSPKCQLKEYHQNSTCSSVGFSENLSLNFFGSKEEFLAPIGVRKEDTPAGHGKTQQPEHH
jgi:hypothetical protein